MKKQTIKYLGIVLILVIVLGVVIAIAVNDPEYNNIIKDIKGENKSISKETKASAIEEGEIITDNQVNLDNYDSNVTIKNGGEYELKGILSNTLLINSPEDVILNLNGVDIESKETAAIANIGEGALTIKIAENTTNILSDGGSSEYDACLYSKKALNIEGNGMLTIKGKQEEGKGIATENNNITINSGVLYIESKDDGINAVGDGGEITINGGEIDIKANRRWYRFR